MLTDYAGIGTAAEAIKLGTCQYLAKASNTNDIELTNRAINIKSRRLSI